MKTFIITLTTNTTKTGVVRFNNFADAVDYLDMFARKYSCSYVKDNTLIINDEQTFTIEEQQYGR